jgi:hypothetical protein
MRIISGFRFHRLVVAVALILAVDAYAHITPTVVLARRGDVIKDGLPSAANFFVRKVELGQLDIAKIEAQGNFTPQVSKLEFFYGEDDSNNFVGSVLFNQVNTIHGPVEVGIVFTPGGDISEVVVTKATVETEPWVKTAISFGLMKNFIGLRARSMWNPLKSVSKSRMGDMPYFMAQAITAAVMRGVVYYDVLFRPHQPS